MEPGFVSATDCFPAVRLDIRYAGSHNLTGHPLAGYKAPKALMTAQAADAFGEAVALAEKYGYGFLIYDAYRPQKAVNDFIKWAELPENGETKQEFYPELCKADLFPQGYIASRSGHSRGSVIDLTLTQNGIPLDMGTEFDFMHPKSHHMSTEVTDEQRKNRACLRGIMAWAGFEPYSCEWWHYRLMDEPFPDTYFDFDIE